MSAKNPRYTVTKLSQTTYNVAWTKLSKLIHPDDVLDEDWSKIGALRIGETYELSGPEYSVTRTA